VHYGVDTIVQLLKKFSSFSSSETKHYNVVSFILVSLFHWIKVHVGCEGILTKHFRLASQKKSSKSEQTPKRFQLVCSSIHNFFSHVCICLQNFFPVINKINFFEAGLSAKAILKIFIFSVQISFRKKTKKTSFRIFLVFPKSLLQWMIFLSFRFQQFTNLMPVKIKSILVR
jgi:hypothetical protein